MLQQVLRYTLVLCLLAALGFAQSEIGGATLNGTVTDASGAAVPNAKSTEVDSATPREGAISASAASAALPTASWWTAPTAITCSSARPPDAPARDAIPTVSARTPCRSFKSTRTDTTPKSAAPVAASST